MQLRRITALVATVVFASFVATGCGSKENGVLGIGGIPGDAICKVGGDAISKAEFNSLIDRAKAGYKNQGQDFPKKGSDEYNTFRKQAVDFLIERQLHRQEAGKLGVKVTDKQVDKRLKDAKKSLFQGDDKKFKEEMKKAGVSIKDVKTQYRDELLDQKLQEKLTSDFKVTDADAKKYYNDNKDQYKTPESREVAHILVAAKDKALADKIYNQVKGGDQKLFAKLAKQYSTDPGSKDQGGVLTITRGQTVPEFDAESFKLKTGETSKPVKTQFGFHIIQARTNVTAAKQQKFADVKSTIKDTLKQNKVSKRMSEWRDDLRKNAEDDVVCRKGYVWTQTVKETKPASTPPVVTTDDKKAKDGKKAKGDKKAGDDSKKADDKKSDDSASKKK